MSLELYLAICATLFGLVMGSGMTALSWRLPRGESWAHGRSRCPNCGHVLGVLDLFPVFSWLLSGGKCRHCGVKVSPRYPFIELLCGTWSLLVFLRDGLTWSFPLVAIWGFLMVALLFIDLDFQLLPDALTFPGSAIAIAAALLGPGWRHALSGILVGAGLLWLVAEVYLRVRKVEGMGGGDVKLAVMFGALLGPGAALLTIFLASFAGAIWGGVLMARKQGDGMTALPFGTMLCPAAMVAYLWGDHWVAWYARLLHP